MQAAEDMNLAGHYAALSLARAVAVVNYPPLRPFTTVAIDLTALCRVGNVGFKRLIWKSPRGPTGAIQGGEREAMVPKRQYFILC